MGNYFIDDEKDVEFFSSGSTLLDRIMGGGYPESRVINLVGDKSSGKSLLCIEACANYHLKYPNRNIWYNECESAFDKGYAATLGMPVEAITFVGEEHPDANRLIEGLFEHLESLIEKGDPGLYLVDSLDALSDKSENERSIDQGTFGAAKAKLLSQLFRRQIRKLEASGITLIIVSQIRDKMNVSFGKKTSRSGGRALDFYASIVLFLADIKKHKKTIKKVERPVGVQIKAKCEKNKVGMPFRECQFPIMFGFGIDSLRSNLEWLKEVCRLEEIDVNPGSITRTINKYNSDVPYAEYVEFSAKIEAHTIKVWKEIERDFLPKRSKYGNVLKDDESLPTTAPKKKTTTRKTTTKKTVTRKKVKDEKNIIEKPAE